MTILERITRRASGPKKAFQCRREEIAELRKSAAPFKRDSLLVVPEELSRRRPRSFARKVQSPGRACRSADIMCAALRSLKASKLPRSVLPSTAIADKPSEGVRSSAPTDNVARYASAAHPLDVGFRHRRPFRSIPGAFGLSMWSLKMSAAAFARRAAVTCCDLEIPGACATSRREQKESDIHQRSKTLFVGQTHERRSAR